MPMKIDLLPHQQEVIDKLKDTDAVLVYHGLGAGKSSTSIAATEGQKTDVVVPASLRENYGKELRKFNAKSSDRNVISYNQFLKDGPSKGTKYVVFDEPQKVGRTESQISQSVLDSVAAYPKRILLTGTPASNHPHELAPIIRMLSPEATDVPLDPSSFKEKFIDYKKTSVSFWDRLRGIKPGVELTPKNLDIIQKAIKGKVSYFTPPQENYPERIDVTRKVEASPEQVGYYKYVTKRADPIIALKIGMNLPLSKSELNNVNAFMAAARQVSNSTKPYGGKGTSPKVEAVTNDFLDRLKGNPEHKGIIYSNYLESGINEVSQRFDDNGVPYAKFVGSMSDKQKKKAVEDYNEGKVRAILVSGSGAEGLDLKNTRSIQLLEPHWNQNRIEQVIGRGIRYKSHESLPEQDRNVEVIKYQTTLPKTFFQKAFKKDPSTSSDEYLEDLGVKKQKILDKFLDVFKSEGSVPNMSKLSYLVNRR